MFRLHRHKCFVISRHHSLPRLFTDQQFIGVALAAHVRASSKYEIVSNEYIDISGNLEARFEARDRYNNEKTAGKLRKTVNIFKTRLYSLFQEGDRHSAVARAVITGARPRSAAILRQFLETTETQDT